ncbi:MAG: hypothetical protein D6732_07520 [Methanobacteriota archaeon]|nr:MAG: hypothetical protein D6732_07520 [Euryarchaeota archaeon]
MNSIEIRGPKEEVNKLYDRIEQSGEVLQTIHDIGEWDYDKAIEEWGTKWDIDANEANIDLMEAGSDSILFINADTAWSPPLKALEYLVKNNPSLSADAIYFEPDMGFCGHFNAYCEDGEICVIDDCYDITHENIDELPEELVDAFGIRSFYEFEEDEEESIEPETKLEP